MDRIYLDHAATTPMDPQVLEVMTECLTHHFGNASSISQEGQYARQTIDDARHDISRILECSLEEIIFLSCATEASNFAIKGVLEAWRVRHGRVPHFITTSIEHSCIKNTAQYLQDQGLAEVTFLPVDQMGIVNADDLRNSFQDNTALVATHYVNNEIGAVEPVSRLGKICRKREIPFFVDAVQAPGYFPLSVEKLHCDLLSLSAHKFYGPKGIALLYVRRGTEIVALIHGGGQERSYRSGTENVAAITAMARALEIAEEKRISESERLRELQYFGYQLMQSHFPDVRLNGPPIGDMRTPNNLHFSFGELDGESLLIRLDLNGIAASLGSACTSGVLDPSHVLKAIGLPFAQARSGLRLTMGRSTTKQTLERAIPLIAQTVRDIQQEQEFLAE